MVKPILYGYWRSGASYRVRIALYFKNIEFDYVAVNLLKNEQKQANYLDKNPVGLVPSLQIDDTILFNSPAIINYLETIQPQPSLKLSTAVENAKLEAYCQTIIADTQPLGNISVLNYLKDNYKLDKTTTCKFALHWIERSFMALEKITSLYNGPFAFGAKITLADIYLAPQIYTAKRYGLNFANYPNLIKVSEKAAKHPAFIKAHPDAQPDAVK